MVYRPIGNNIDYRIVQGSVHSVTRTQSQVNGFGCDIEPLGETQQFQVQQNDVIAACTVDTSSAKPLRVHAQDADGHKLMKLDIDTGNSDSCSSSDLTQIEGSKLKKRMRFALHLFANIGKCKNNLYLI